MREAATETERQNIPTANNFSALQSEYQSQNRPHQIVKANCDSACDTGSPIQKLTCEVQAASCLVSEVTAELKKNNNAQAKTQETQNPSPKEIAVRGLQCNYSSPLQIKCEIDSVADLLKVKDSNTRQPADKQLQDESYSYRAAAHRLRIVLSNHSGDLDTQSQMLKSLDTITKYNKSLGHFEIGKWNDSTNTWNDVKLVPNSRLANLETNRNIYTYKKGLLDSEPKMDLDRFRKEAAAPPPIPGGFQDFTQEGELIALALGSGDTRQAAERLQQDLKQLKGESKLQDILLDNVENLDPGGYHFRRTDYGGDVIPAGKDEAIIKILKCAADGTCNGESDSWSEKSKLQKSVDDITYWFKQDDYSDFKYGWAKLKDALYQRRENISEQHDLLKALSNVDSQNMKYHLELKHFNPRLGTWDNISLVPSKQLADIYPRFRIHTYEKERIQDEPPFDVKRFKKEINSGIMRDRTHESQVISQALGAGEYHEAVNRLKLALQKLNRDNQDVLVDDLIYGEPGRKVVLLDDNTIGVVPEGNSKAAKIKLKSY